MDDLRLYQHPDSQLPIERGRGVTLDLEGRPVSAFASEPVAVALFASGVHVLSRSIRYHRPRCFFCLAGHCASCLMRVDGIPNVRTCRTLCRDGVRLERQNAFPSASHDLLGVVDWLFSSGMDHHHLMTGSRALNQVMLKVVRQLSGLGRLPEQPPGELPRAVRRKVEILVVGGGPAGLAAATAAARSGRQVLLVDEGDLLGGSLHAYPTVGAGPRQPVATGRPSGAARAAQLAAEASAAGAELLSEATALGYYSQDEGGILAVTTPRAFLRLSAERTVFAGGGYDQAMLFPDNDRPGILAARAVGRLACRYFVRPARRAVVVGSGPYARALCDRLAAIGTEVVFVDGQRSRVVAAHGQSWVSAVEIRGEDGKLRKVACDLVAVASTPAPASEPARQAGATVWLRPEGGGFAVRADVRGRTASGRIFACGDLCGHVGPEMAEMQGEIAGLSAAIDLGVAASFRQQRDALLRAPVLGVPGKEAQR